MTVTPRGTTVQRYAEGHFLIDVRPFRLAFSRRGDHTLGTRVYRSHTSCGYRLWALHKGCAVESQHMRRAATARLARRITERQQYSRSF